MGYKCPTARVKRIPNRIAPETRRINAPPPQNMLVKRGLPYPTYTYETSAISNAPFKCNIALNSCTSSHQTVGQGVTKKASKHDASKNLYRILTDNMDELRNISKPRLVSLRYDRILLVSLSRYGITITDYKEV